MPSDRESWEQACERVGVKPTHIAFLPTGQKAYVSGPTKTTKLEWPRIGDPAACIAMLEWMAPYYAIVKKISLNWQVSEWSESLPLNGDWSLSLPLALAAAVNAVKENPDG